MMNDVKEIALRAREASKVLAVASTELKNNALLEMADALRKNSDYILQENKKDLEVGRKEGLSNALMDRLMLNSKRVMEMAEGLEQVVSLRDPIGEITDGWVLPNGLIVEKVRVPLGVIGIIYEARPNVTVDSAGLCLKSGNAVILRGSSSALSSNRALTKVIRDAVEKAGLPPDVVCLVDQPGREAAVELMRLHGLIDVLIPRGGEGLIKTVVENSTVPVIETGVGNCHIYVDEGADLEMALNIIINAKTQRPGVCNACEKLLVNSNVAQEFLPSVYRELKERGVEIRACERTREIIPEAKEATEEDWYREYLDLILAVKIVDNIEEAINHINKYGSKHSDAIITNDYTRSRIFCEAVDSAAVYVNASTRFTDGGQFGMGAEIGISTQKLHARGPMSLPELTSTKFVIRGNGQIRE